MSCILSEVMFVTIVYHATVCRYQKADSLSLSIVLVFNMLPYMCVCVCVCEGRKEMFYLTMHSTHFI